MTSTILLDLEGTTTPIAFVYAVLFPYARAHVREYLCDHQDAADPDVLHALNVLKDEWIVDAAGADAPSPSDHSIDALVAYVEWLMDRDRKSPGLKRLQGLVWERGYRSGELRGEVFDDVPPALERWREAGVQIAIYSSGSVLAQRLLFGTTAAGDLTTFISGFFDTEAGPKASADSYRRIAASLDQAPGEMLFVSDVAAEIAAARSAGCRVALCVRPGNAPQRVSEDVPIVHTFDEMFLPHRPREKQ